MGGLRRSGPSMGSVATDRLRLRRAGAYMGVLAQRDFAQQPGS